MELKRIIDKETKIWKRDDFAFNHQNEICIDAIIPSNLHSIKGICPLWDGEKWVQNIEPPIPEPQLEEPTESERIEALEQALLEIVLGGVF